MPKHISNDKRNDAKAMLSKGKNVREVARQLGISQGTVSNIRGEMNLEIPQHAGGRPGKISKNLGRKVLQGLSTGVFKTAKDAQRFLADQQVVVSEDTVRRFLKSAKMTAIHKPKVLPLTPKRMKDRLEWAEAHRSWTINDWRSVMFSDETKINRIGSDGAQWVWKADDKELKAFQLDHLYKHGGGSIMLWGCFCWKGPGFLAKINGKMDSELYTQIIDDELVRSLEFYGYTEDDAIFQHDNDPKHTSKHTKRHLKDCNIQVLDWPSFSPDLNPIENLWSIVKRRLAAFDTAPGSIAELFDRVTQIWNNIDPETCNNLVESMPNRIADLIAAKGGQIPY